MDINQRIAQFESMVAPGADPGNDMAWFSLGTAYSQAGRHQDAAGAFVRCYIINKDMSKAYQLAAQAFAQAGENDKAVKVAAEGYAVASAKGDFMPKKAMGELLARLGAPVPEVEEAKAAPGAVTPGFVDHQTGRAGIQLPRPPFKGPVGEWIHGNVSVETWDAWIRQGTKVINELRLDLSREQDAETYDKYMREYLGIDDEMFAKLTAR